MVKGDGGRMRGGRRGRHPRGALWKKSGKMKFVK